MSTNQDHCCGEKSVIDDYIAGKPERIQVLLRAVRDTIRSVIPEATEKISWQMPTFWHGENIVHFAAFKNHIGFFPGREALSVFAERLEGYNTSRGTIQFPFSQPIDHTLIADITRWRHKEAENGRSTYARPTTRARYEMPDFISAAITESNLWERYRARPLYQQNDYIGWIMSAKREETRQKRLDQLLNELRNGDAYMGMAYNAADV